MHQLVSVVRFPKPLISLNRGLATVIAMATPLIDPPCDWKAIQHQRLVGNCQESDSTTQTPAVPLTTVRHNYSYNDVIDM